MIIKRGCRSTNFYLLKRQPRMYDDLRGSDGDNPAIDIVLCADTDEDIAKYSVLHGNEQFIICVSWQYLEES